ncbi:MAG: hypothetical protein NT126_11320 [Bacteroidetes bacterium]|nr:hypothetical protein [Bacteroidota bacterium]
MTEVMGVKVMGVKVMDVKVMDVKIIKQNSNVERTSALQFILF